MFSEIMPRFASYCELEIVNEATDVLLTLFAEKPPIKRYSSSICAQR